MILPVNLITAGTSTELSVGQKVSPIALLSPRLKSIDQAGLALNLLAEELCSVLPGSVKVESGPVWSEQSSGLTGPSWLSRLISEPVC